ncbi:uncharacterized protein LOC121835301 [Ixodes scapularis]|uniref:uncharacterized protein LOC121835301 n=1 Tax=Ixodes scapularis TaxID=6945 RepID=UPI001C38843F|nr:uncharacterized protein LOC121835301 [Ixodes scapularis]
MSRVELTALGRELGYDGVELRNWVRDEMDREDVRQAKAKEMIELKIRLKEVENASPTNGSGANHGAVLTSPQRWMAAFDEKKDDLDAYLLRFERLALGQLWPRDQWATMLALCLKGEALSVISRLTPEESVDYEGVKKALMRRFRLTAEGFREKFRNAKPENGETGAQFAARLASLFDRWVELAETMKEYDTLRNLVLTEQFIKGCSPKLAIFIKERGSKTLDDMADLADRFLEAQGAQSLGFKSEEKKPNPDAPRDGNKKPAGEGRPPLRCFLCNRMGHRAADCREKGPKTPSCWRCGRTGHTANSCQGGCQDGTRGRSQASCCVAAESAQMNDALLQNGYMKLTNGERLPIVNSTIAAETKHLTDGVPVRTGKVGKRIVTILRDTGCNTVVVRRSLIADEDLTGTSKAVSLVDGTVKVLPEARLSMRTPFFSGEVTALCMESPLYDIILGNIPGALAAGESNPDWDVEAADTGITTEGEEGKEVEPTMSAAVETRLQKKSSQTAGSKPLKVPEIQNETVTPEALRAEQRKDESLRSCFLNEGKKMTVKKKRHSCEFVMKEGVLYRIYRTNTAREVHQLVVPRRFRDTVLKMAHDGILAGHQGTQKTMDRVLEEFFWPGVGADVKRFVKSCDRCQRTTPRGKVAKMPLGSMPLIGTPFQRVAVDIVGPLAPTTKKGNKYILTMVDYATRYPDAVALPEISTERVAEGLVEMFTRTGVPREVLSDRGSNFTSDVMSEVARLLSMRQLFTTPYHPMGNGLVEKFNGTLKTMLKRMCQEKPADWDRYLAPLLFAYREVPQASLGFSPFELLYGRNVRGPLSVLKELWTNESLDGETKTTYEYVFELRNKLEETCKIAHEELTHASERYRRGFNRKARSRVLVVGDRVLILLPTDQNKLLMQWKGPYSITAKRGELDYEVDLGHSTKLFHGNLLKKYEERQTEGAAKACNVVTFEEEEREPDFPLLRMEASESSKDVAFGAGLSAQQRTDAEAVVERYHNIFSDLPGKTDLLGCELRTSTDLPVRTKQYPLPFAGEKNHVMWGTPHEAAFQKLKKDLTEAPIRRLPDFQKMFVLRTDASDHSIGAILLQKHGDVLHPVAYASRRLLPREEAYATVEREGLALVWGIEKFKPYLYGRAFLLQTDHQPLQYINQTRHANARVMRWSLKLQEFDFRVQYIKGKENVGADYLSRL